MPVVREVRIPQPLSSCKHDVPEGARDRRLVGQPPVARAVVEKENTAGRHPGRGGRPAGHPGCSGEAAELQRVGARWVQRTSGFDLCAIVFIDVHQRHKGVDQTFIGAVHVEALGRSAGQSTDATHTVAPAASLRGAKVGPKAGAAHAHAMRKQGKGGREHTFMSPARRRTGSAQASADAASSAHEGSSASGIDTSKRPPECRLHTSEYLNVSAIGSDPRARSAPMSSSSRESADAAQAAHCAGVSKPAPGRRTSTA
eukprot:scaffold3000_cov134-Isochrysis_galbana.AAC.1